MAAEERLEAMRWLLGKAAKKYQNRRILEMPLNLEDRGNENKSLKQYSMCYSIGQNSRIRFGENRDQHVPSCTK